MKRTSDRRDSKLARTVECRRERRAWRTLLKWAAWTKQWRTA